MDKLCIGRRPNGHQCSNPVPKGNRFFCDRCSDENSFRNIVEFQEIETDRPNPYEPEPVEIPFLDVDEDES
jgi:hypothetical protein